MIPNLGVISSVIKKLSWCILLIFYLRHHRGKHLSWNIIIEYPNTVNQMGYIIQYFKNPANIVFVEFKPLSLGQFRV